MQKNNIKSAEFIERCFVLQHDKVMEFCVFFGKNVRKLTNMLTISKLQFFSSANYCQKLTLSATFRPNLYRACFGMLKLYLFFTFTYIIVKDLSRLCLCNYQKINYLWKHFFYVKDWAYNSLIIKGKFWACQRV